VPETTDNDGDGKVDLADVAEAARADCYACPSADKRCKPGDLKGSGPSSCGPLDEPPAPADDTDARFHFNAVTPGGFPLAFTNPLLLDRDGDGKFTGPGLPEGGE
jgi:hypothetical protein